MPIYEYTCARCGVEKEIFHRMSEQPRIACDNCEGEYLQKLVSAAGFRLKGGGWYETDFKSEGRRNLASGAGSETTGDAADKGAKTGEAGKADKASGGDKPAAAEPTTKAAKGADKAVAGKAGTATPAS